MQQPDLYSRGVHYSHRTRAWNISVIQTLVNTGDWTDGFLKSSSRVVARLEMQKVVPTVTFIKDDDYRPIFSSNEVSDGEFLNEFLRWEPPTAEMPGGEKAHFRLIEGLFPFRTGIGNTQDLYLPTTSRIR
jgi:hypothetical protein